MTSVTDQTEPIVDAEVQYVRNIEIYDVAEDVKAVRFEGDGTTVEVGITDETIVEFAEVAKEVFDRVHRDMDAMRDLFENAGDEEPE